jgi:hypothetical protein
MKRSREEEMLEFENVQFHGFEDNFSVKIEVGGNLTITKKTSKDQWAVELTDANMASHVGFGGPPYEAVLSFLKVGR